MDFTNWLCEDDAVIFEAAEQAFGLREFVRMSGNSRTALYSEVSDACNDFRGELVKRGMWERFTQHMGMSDS